MAASAVKRAIVIAGPTASGKSAVALALAERYGGTVINADSMQVYGDLGILTARPSPSDMRRVPHLLFGHVDAAEAYSVGRWVSEVRALLAEDAAQERLPIFVGGTGLYLQALTEGLSDIPAIPADVRTRIRAEASTVAPEALHARLAATDPDMAKRLRPSDPQRITRALEVFEATGRSLLAYQARRTGPIVAPETVIGVFLDLPRETLNARIDQRFDTMMTDGALDEVARLARRDLDITLPVMRALGVPHLLTALSGASNLEVAVSRAKLASRQYAKRQVTFARHQLQHLRWTNPTDAITAVAREMVGPDF